MDADGFSVLRHEFAQRRREACDRIDGAYPAPATVTTPAALPVGVPVPGEDGWRDRDPGPRPRMFRARITTGAP